MQPTTIGLFVGLILGLTMALQGFGEMLGVALAGAAGYLVVRFLVEGDDFGEFVERFRPGR